MGVLLFWLAVLGMVMTVYRFMRSSPGILSQLPAGAGDGNMKALSMGSTGLCSTESNVPPERGLAAMEVGLGSSLKAHFADGSGREPMCRAEGTVDAKSCFLSMWPHLLSHPPKTTQGEWKVCLPAKTWPPLPWRSLSLIPPPLPQGSKGGLGKDVSCPMQTFLSHLRHKWPPRPALVQSLQFLYQLKIQKLLLEEN